MTDSTARHALPLLAAGQAQKEITHNEALTLIDALLMPVATGVGDNAPPLVPTVGQCWIVGTAPTGDWTGHQNRLVIWTEGGWRSLALPAGSSLRDAAGKQWRYGRDGWSGPAPIAVPAGGGVIDAEARAAIASILNCLGDCGMITD